MVLDLLSSHIKHGCLDVNFIIKIDDETYLRLESINTIP